MKIRKFLKSLFFSSKLYDYYLKKNQLQDIAFTPKDAWPGDPLLGDSFVQGHYNLAGNKVYAPDIVLWKITSPDNYWEREIHSFSWLRHLKARSGSLARKNARYLIVEWIQFYNTWNEKAWEVGLTCGGKISVYVERDFNLSHLLDEMIQKIKSRQKEILKR